VGGSYGAIVFLDVKTGSVVRKLDHDVRQVGGLAFSPDGKTLASEEASGWGATVILWNATSGKRIRTLDDHRIGIAFSPDGELFADGAADGTIRLWDAAKGSLVRSLVGLRSTGARDTPLLDFSSDGKSVLAGDRREGTLLAWDVAGGGILRSLSDYAAEFWSAAFSPDGRVLAAGSWGVVDLWDVPDRVPLKQLVHAQTGCAVSRVAFSPDGQSLITSAQAADPQGDGAAAFGCTYGLQLWDTSTWTARPAFARDADGIFALDCSPDAKYLATGSPYGGTKLFDAASLTRLRELSELTGYVNSVCFSPDGTALAAIDQEGTIKTWSVPKWRLLRTMQGSHSQSQRDRDAGRQPYHGWTCLAYSPDGRWLASGSNGPGEVLIWDPTSGELLQTIAAYGGNVMAFSPNGRFLAATRSGSSPRIAIIDTGNWLVARTLEGPEGSFVHDLAFSPDSSLLASASYDGTVLLWDAEAFAP
jgi:WD40 repeat protein